MRVCHCLNLSKNRSDVRCGAAPHASWTRDEDGRDAQDRGRFDSAVHSP
jgi:hypothetical protein